MNSPPGTAEDLAPVTEPVAMVLSRQARPGQEQASEEVLHRRAGVVIVILLMQYAVMPLLTGATRGFRHPDHDLRPTGGAA